MYYYLVWARIKNIVSKKTISLVLEFYRFALRCYVKINKRNTKKKKQKKTTSKFSHFYKCYIKDTNKLLMSSLTSFQGNWCMHKVNIRSTGKSYKICSELTLKAPEWLHWLHYGGFVVNFEHISHFFLVFQLLTLLN